MSFSFNFEDPNSSSTPVEKAPSSESERHENEKISVKTAVEVTEFYEDEIVNKLEITKMDFNNSMLKVIDTKNIEQTVLNDPDLNKLLQSSNVLEAVCTQSDLVSGTYEGGLKIWECAIDLTEFLNSCLNDPSMKISNKSVLEVGCGAGLPGLFCLKNGAKCVHFQDFNEEVLKLLTRNNVKLSFEDGVSNESEACRYFSGDWSSFTDLACKENLKYEVILTAETIYNEENYGKLHTLFEKLLSKNGFVLVAAKSYYFGVGGNVEAFLEYVCSKKIFTSEKVHTVSKGVTRCIILMQRTQEK